MKKVYHIIPEMSNGDAIVNHYDESKLIRSSFVYLHGDLQNKAGYDIFSFLDEKPEEEGIYDTIVEFPDMKVLAKAFLWKAKIGGKGLQGLVVSVDDEMCMKDAENKYNNKEYCI